MWGDEGSLIWRCDVMLCVALGVRGGGEKARKRENTGVMTMQLWQRSFQICRELSASDGLVILEALSFHTKKGLIE